MVSFCRHYSNTVSIPPLPELYLGIIKTVDLLANRDLKATEAKMLRVAVSSFYDYLQVVIKTFQEFDNGAD